MRDKIKEEIEKYTYNYVELIRARNNEEIDKCVNKIIKIFTENSRSCPSSIIRRLDGIVKAYEIEVKIAEKCKKEWKGKNINAYNFSEQRRSIFLSVISTLKEIMTNV